MTCKHCGREFKRKCGRQIFCQQRCQVLSHAKRHRGIASTKYCLHCGRVLVRKVWRSGRVEWPSELNARQFCDRKCARECSPSKKQRKREAAQTRPHTGFHVNLIREWLQEWR